MGEHTITYLTYLHWPFNHVLVFIYNLNTHTFFAMAVRFRLL